MEAFNPPKLDIFYRMVNSCVALGRPCIIHGVRGTGKTYLLTNLRPHWRCDGIQDTPDAVIFFSATPVDNPVGVFRALISRVTYEPPPSNRPSELRFFFENALLQSSIRLIIIDDAESVKIDLFRLIWASLETVRSQGHPVGMVVSHTEHSGQLDLLPSPPDIANILPVFGTFNLVPLTFSQCVIALSHWLPQFGPVVETLKKNDQSEDFRRAAHLASEVLRLTRGLLLELSDLAFVWNQNFRDAPPNQETLRKICLFRGQAPPP